MFFFFFVIVFVRSECHRNWDHYGNSCYLFSDHELNWYEAEVIFILLYTFNLVYTTRFWNVLTRHNQRQKTKAKYQYLLLSF